MSRDHLLFRLAGPLASFGAPAVGELRDSWAAPSKSAVLGLVAAALGLRREAEAGHLALHEGYGFAVRTDVRPGRLRDFHTAQAPRGRDFPSRAAEVAKRPLAAVLSERDYLVGGGWTVVLWSRARSGAPALAAVAARLRRPHYIPYLGRRACPLSEPPDPRLVSAGDPLEALRLYDLACGRAAAEAAEVWSEAEATGPDEIRFRRDSLRSRRDWSFRERPEARLGPAAHEGG